MQLFVLLIGLFLYSCGNEKIQIFEPEQPVFAKQAKIRYLDIISSKVKVTKNILYSVQFNEAKQKIEKLTFDLYEPKNDNERNRWVVVVVHGGGFVRGSKKSVAYQAEYLAKRGYVAVAVDYRLVNNTLLQLYLGHKYAGADVRSAIRFLRNHSFRFSINPNKIAAIGGSAGAAGVLGAAFKQEYEFANTDNHGQFDGTPQVISEFAGFLLDAKQSIEPNEPPVQIFHSKGDNVVPVKAAYEIIDACVAYNIPYEAHIISGERHNIFKKRWKDFAPDVLRWFYKHLRGA